MSICELAVAHGVHRRTVWAALVSSVPPPRKVTVRPAPDSAVLSNKVGAITEGTLRSAEDDLLEDVYECTDLMGNVSK